MQTLASCAVIPSEESLFGLFRATKSSQAKEFFPLLANFIDETNRTAARLLRGNSTAFPLLPGLPGPTYPFIRVPKSKNDPKIAGSLKSNADRVTRIQLAGLRKEIREI